VLHTSDGDVAGADLGFPLVTRVSATLLALALGVGLLAACTKSTQNPSQDSTVTSTVTRTRTAPVAAFKPSPASTVTPLPPGAGPLKGEVEKACPYIVSSHDQGENSLADLEGDRVYRTTVLTTMNPVGCRFYFWAGPFEAIAEIATQRFGSAQDAHDAMILISKTGKQVQGYPDLLPGIDAVSYRTKFFGPDGSDDWACVFAKGKIVVTVRTQRNDNNSLSARLIAKQIAPKF
jgi:hypothetical protein